MKRIVRSAPVWITLAAGAAYWCASPFLGTDQLIRVSTASLWVVSGVVGPSYAVQAIQAVRKDESVTVQHITFGIAFGWLATFCWMTDRMLWLSSHYPDFLARNKLVAGAVLGAGIGCFFHLTSPGVFGKKMQGFWPRAAICGVVLAIVVALSTIMVAAPPDLTWLAELVEPYVPR